MLCPRRLGRFFDYLSGERYDFARKLEREIRTADETKVCELANDNVHDGDVRMNRRQLRILNHMEEEIDQPNKGKVEGEPVETR